MKSITMIFFIVSIAFPLFAVEQDNAVITVPTGWTVEKAAYEAQWETFATSERYTALAELETRLVELMPQLPENEYSAEDGEFVGYRIRLEQVRDRAVTEPDAWHYAEFAALLDEAETFVWYTTRERILERNVNEEGLSWNESETPPGRETMLAGEGWYYVDIDNGLTDHFLPRICSYDNYVFITASSYPNYIGDTVFLWRSTDYGQTWSNWTNLGTNVDSRMAFDLAIDPGNEYLYQTYRYQAGLLPPRTCWIRRFEDLNSTATIHHPIDNTSYMTNSPMLSVEHEYPDHRLCCMYYNGDVDQTVIKRSTDNGQTWSTVHTWGNTVIPRIRGCQGASSTYDRFYFVAKKDAYTITVFESANGGTGTWTETDYVHAQAIDMFDISASHNTAAQSTVVAFSYFWGSDEFNVRILFRTTPGGNWVSQLVDGYGEMTISRMPTVTVDREWAPNSTDPDYYHLAFYKDHDEDGDFIPIALRCLNDSLELDGMVIHDPSYFEMIGSTAIDTLVSAFDYGYPSADPSYQIDITTVWNPTHNQWFPAIVWMYKWQSLNRDPVMSMPDEDYVGVAELKNITPVFNFVTLTPNPARDAANLTYRLSIESPVEISLFDATGRFVKPLVNEVQTAGDHRLALDYVGLATGIYFVRVSTDQGTETETMTIIR